MKEHFFLLFLLIILLNLSCHSRNKELVADDAPVLELPEEADNAPLLYNDTLPQITIPDPPPPPKVVASIKRTPCFGRCPVFEVRIYSNGEVVYHGERFVEKIGVFEAEVAPAFIDSLFQKASEIGFFSLRSEYPDENQKIPDLPNTITYLHVGDQEKKITNNHNAPQALISYEKFFLAMIEKLDWKERRGE